MRLLGQMFMPTVNDLRLLCNEKLVFEHPPSALALLDARYFSLKKQAGLKLAILLPQPPKCWDYSCMLSHLAFGRTFTCYTK
jgi:hypothetical protein